MKTTFIIIGSLFLYFYSYAAEKEVSPEIDSLIQISVSPEDTDTLPVDNSFPLTFGFDLVTRYVWRGVDFGFTPAFQPGFAYAVGRKKINFEIGAWGSYSVAGNFAEVDLYATLSFPYVWVGVIDYFFPVEASADDQYFRYGNNTFHVFEGLIGFDGPENFPLKAFAAYNFHTATVDPENSASGAEKDIYYEISYPFSLRKDVSLDVFAGAANGSYYTQNGKFNIVNVGFSATKSFRVKDKVTIPLSVSLISNPDTQKLFFVAAIGLWNQ